MKIGVQENPAKLRTFEVRNSKRKLQYVNIRLEKFEYNKTLKGISEIHIFVS